jgi:hypothetical protein
VTVLVCGGRDYADEDRVAEVLAELPAGSVLIHGDARGADRLARDVGRLFGFRDIPYPARWSEEGRAAGIKRNQRMLDAHPEIDLVIAFPGGAGTLDMTVRARRRMLPIQYVDWPPG